MNENSEIACVQHVCMFYVNDLGWLSGFLTHDVGTLNNHIGLEIKDHIVFILWYITKTYLKYFYKNFIIPLKC
ncbi:hypothetical protein DERP_002500 [Dermatophagoides pteronyssinus]|uniref:Uncharacterized protein n=1 Tax=Dermatophagoides pteronyssinus TaxID=6956 RepID=A0ABQ8JI01_DERPT|nr:hypothetical protein DERP_002500 [Dermatophagoides pteronyssinus]